MADDLLDLFVSTTEDYGIIFLDPDGRVDRWSRGAERLFGYEAGEVEGTLAHQIFVPPDRQAGVPEIELQVAREQGRAEDERWHLRKDGTRFWASGVMIALREKRGPSRICQSRSEDDWKKRFAIRRSSKASACWPPASPTTSTMFSPRFSAIFRWYVAACRVAQSGAQLNELLGAAERAGNRAADLVKQLLNYAGKGRRELRPVDICHVTRDALAILQASVSRKIRIVADVPEDCLVIEADVTQLQQLVLNLVLNGAEAIGDNHGEVSVRVRVRDVPDAERAEKYAGFALQGRRYTELEVRDTGTGMDEQTLRQIFDPFFTTKFMGRGLGLAAALGIV